MGLFSNIRDSLLPPENRADPAEETRVREEFRGRRAEAARHYRSTGDSSRMWAEKSAQNDAIWAARHPSRKKRGA